jgi:two-component system, cell cycle sensor histidine kinase and response regulator CckA
MPSVAAHARPDERVRFGTAGPGREWKNREVVIRAGDRLTRSLPLATILIVDNLAADRTEALPIATCEASTAANADDARRQSDRHPSIDVLLTDVVMPGGSGPELTRHLVQRRPGLKVIYMSGYTEDTIVHHGVLAPGIAFLQKPFTGESLGRKIRETLDGDDGGASVRPGNGVHGT